MKKLEFQLPFITTWTWLAGLLAILLPHPETAPWIFSNYIQIICAKDTRRKDSLFIDYAPFGAVAQLRNCPWIETQSISRRLFTKLGLQIKEFLIDILENNGYIYMLINEKYILNLKHDYMHEILILGFAEETQSFLIADFTTSKSGRYTIAYVSAEAVVRGFSDIKAEDDYLRGIWVLQFNAKAVFPFNKQCVKEGIESFLCSRQMYCYDFRIYDSLPILGFGIETYQFILNKAELCIEQGVAIDIRMLHMLFDYHALMNERIHYMTQTGIIKNDSQNFESCKNALMLSENLKLTAMKYNIKGFTEKTLNVLQMIEKLRDYDRIIYGNILKKL